jgi:predicted DNA-binding ribbon-helix-helix protein
MASETRSYRGEPIYYTTTPVFGVGHAIDAVGPRSQEPLLAAATQQKATASMKSSIIKRSIELNGHKTSVSLEDEFWAGLRAIAETGRIPLPELLQTIDTARGRANLSSAIRVYVLMHYRGLAVAQPLADTTAEPVAIESKSDPKL